MALYASADQINQLWLHEFILVRDIQRFDARQIQIAKLIHYPPSVARFHDQNQVGPLNIGSGKRMATLAAKSG